MFSKGASVILLLCFVFLCVYFSFSYDDQRVTSKEKKMTETNQKPRFVLVHGYGSGAWSWYKVRSLLEASGYDVITLDLKGAGIDTYDSTKVRTFKTYNRPLINFFANLPDDEKVILAGHSAGGLSVTDASHSFSYKIHVAVYVAATMLKHGFVTKQDFEDGAPEFARRGANEVINASEHNQSPISPVHKKESQSCHICPMISQEDNTLISMLMRPINPKAITDARFEGDGADHVRRVYIKTTYDQVLRPKQQDAMIKRWPPSEVFSVKSDHHLIFTDPFVLSGLLVNIAASVECNNLS